MTRKTTLFAGAIVAAGASFVGFAYAHPGEHAAGESGKTVSVKGELIDTACYVASDGDAKGADHAECASKCLATGIPAGILPEGSKDAKAVMFLLTNPKPFAPHAGKTIHVEGTAHADMKAIDVKTAHVVAADGKLTEIKLDDEHHKMGGGADAAKEDGHKEHKY